MRVGALLAFEWCVVAFGSDFLLQPPTVGFPDYSMLHEASVWRSRQTPVEDLYCTSPMKRARERGRKREREKEMDRARERERERDMCMYT